MRINTKPRVIFEKIMRTAFYQVFILVWCSSLVLAFDGRGQEVLNRPISVSIENLQIEQAVKKIGKLASVRFIYSPQVIRSDRKVSLSVQNQPLSEVLNSLLTPLHVTYEVVGSQIILRNVEPRSAVPSTETPATAADETITGTVTDENNAPLPGVTIAVKGTSRGTTTDAQGQFSLSVPSPDVTLVFSFVGYVNQEVSAGNRTQLAIKLAPDTKSLQEVVVVGYGTQKKATLTGAIATVDAKTFQDRGPIASPLAALQGQVPGVAVTRSSSQPGREGWSFLIRGNSSVNSTEPLIIVDGLPIPSASALNSFNPADIDNISFLKDAAAAIYGARAAGGVVLITTKRAKLGKAIIEYNGSVSRKVIGLQPKLVDVNGWGPMIKEAREADAFAPTDIWINLANAAIYAKKNGINNLTYAQWTAAGYTGFTDVKDFSFFDGTMQDILWGNATSQEHQLSVSSRSDKAGYRISLGYLNDGSLLRWGNNSNQRYNLRLVNDYQVSPKLKIESNISLEKNDIIQPSNIGAVLNNGIQPGLPTSTIDGKAYVWGSGIANAAPNNIAQFGGDAKEYNTRLNTNFSATYTFTQKLKAVATAGYYFHNADYRTNEDLIPFYDYSGTQLISTLTPSGANRSFYQRAARREAYYNLNAYLDYGTSFGNDHSLNLTAGAQYERDEVNSFLTRTQDILAGVPTSLALGTGDAASRTNTEAQNHYALAGYFGRANYTFRNKYLLEGNFRYDGSSKFSAENRWKLFGGVLAAWRISQEEFMKNIPFINELKLRASVGTTGNQSGIGLYDYIQLLNLSSSPGGTNSGYPILGTSPAVRVAPGGLVALDRTWERVRTTNFGLDFSVLKNRLSGAAEYFIKNNDNMLIARTYPTVLGSTAPAGNNGNLVTKGWEVSLNWRGSVGQLNYRFGGNVSDFTNKLVDFGGQTLFNSNNRGLNSAVEGYPINSYFGLEYAGRIQTQEQLEAYKKLIPGNNIGIPSGTARNASLQLGDNMFRDLNGDGKLTFEGDAKYLGTDNPRMIYGINGGLDYKGFDFNFIFQGVGERTIIRDGNWRIPAAVLFQAQNSAYLNQWWTPERTDARLPRISSTGTINNYNYIPSDWVAENGAYLRLKNLVFGYTLPQKLTQKARIQRLRLYYSGNDLWEISKITDGWDPEASRTVSNTGDTNNNNQSTFSQRFPFYRFHTVGINLTF
ncbi:TonB-dependent receptor [Spirosoma validum]|uniref:TonB-dependent receptor n=1 Tax=Spirosoma validum TaxID=2771355 RepID=A0A927GCH8_9BACT|nr:TonB-dependent receptor [Spirosoma validum]MBD2752486.1 TonB-dependent receptor [Spirosoma validum]